MDGWMEMIIIMVGGDGMDPSGWIMMIPPLVGCGCDLARPLMRWVEAVTTESMQGESQTPNANYTLFFLSLHFSLLSPLITQLYITL